jgi:hypothetical protein
MQLENIDITEEFRRIKKKQAIRRQAQTPEEIDRDIQKALSRLEIISGRSLKWAEPGRHEAFSDLFQ